MWNPLKYFNIISNTRNGWYVDHFSDGRREGNYKDGVPDGLWKHYDNDGLLIEERTYHTYRTRGGTMDSYGNYNNTANYVYRRTIFSYHKDGQLRKETTYDQEGKLIYSKEY